MRFIFLLFVSASFFTMSLFAQKNNDSISHKKTFNDISIQVNSFQYKKLNFTEKHYSSLASQTDMLKNKNLNGYSKSLQDYTYGQGGYSFLLGLNILQKTNWRNKTNPILRIGGSYGVLRSALMYYRKEDIKSNYVDFESYQILYFTKQTQIEGTILLRTNPQKRIYAYTGLGLNAGVSFANRTLVNYSRGTESNYYNYISFDLDTSMYENHKNKTNYSYYVNIPVGVDFRLGNKKHFWKLMHFQIEPRLVYYSIKIPEAGTIQQFRIQSAFGFRYCFREE
jgi:hypothetical protein